MTVKDLCKLIYELRPDVDISVTGVFGEDINDRAWCYSTIFDSKPPNFENLVTKDEEVTAVKVIKDSKENVHAVYIGFDMSKKEKNMNQSSNKEPLKLLTQLSYIKGDEGDDVWLGVRLETRNGQESKYLFVEGFAENLKSEPAMFSDYYVERILYEEPEEGERHLLIQAVKEE